MPAQDLKKLLERIHLRLDESFVGIGEMLSDFLGFGFPQSRKENTEDAKDICDTTFAN